MFQAEKSSNILACPLDSIQDSNFKFLLKLKCNFQWLWKMEATVKLRVLKWDDCLSVQVPFKLRVEIIDQTLLELELNGSKCEWTKIWTISRM